MGKRPPINPRPDAAVAPPGLMRGQKPGDGAVNAARLGVSLNDAQRSPYESYGLRENPFGVTPDPRFFYESKTHAEARSSLIVGIECGVGFQALIAPPGMGKTTLLTSILEHFDPTARTAFLFQTQGDTRDFLRYFINELGGEAPDSDLVHLQAAINELLLHERQSGRQTIGIIDEAQSLAPAVLETVRLLSNFETPSEKLLHIILAGQPQLAQRLTSPEIAQLSQRICILTTLTPFDLEDTRKYIDHRLRVAGYQGKPLFAPAALTTIWQQSGGIPRDINRLCFNSLLLARAVGKPQVDSDVLSEVTADLDLDRAYLRTETRTLEIPHQSSSFARLRAKDLLSPAFEVPISDTAPGEEFHNPGANPIFDAIDKLCEPELPPAESEPEPEPQATTQLPPEPARRDVPFSEAPPAPAWNAWPTTAPPRAPVESGMVNGGQVATPATTSLFENPLAQTPRFNPVELVEPETDNLAALQELWSNHRATIYLAVAALVLLLALSGWLTLSPDQVASQPTSTPQPAIVPTPVEPSPAPPPVAVHGNPNARVWLDVNSGLYYCKGTGDYGKTDGGKFTTQDSAQDGHYAPADDYCK